MIYTRKKSNEKSDEGKSNCGKSNCRSWKSRGNVLNNGNETIKAHDLQ